MEVKILSRCDADETQHLGSTALSAIDKISLDADAYLSGIRSELSTETNILSGSLSIERKHEYTQELSILDDNFDRSVICMKKFIEANTFSSDETIAKNAEKAFDKLSSYDLSFYKLGYEKELARACSLIEEYEKPDMKPIIDSLVGVSEPLADLKIKANNLNTLYIKNQDIQALKEDVIPSSIQKKVVIDIFNTKLLPYLMVMAKVKPNEYGETYTKIIKYIETINTKIRARRNRTAAEEELDEVVEN